MGESAAATAVTVAAALNNSPLPSATTVTVSRTGGTGTSATDYPVISDFTVTIPSGQTTGTATLSFDPSGDGLAEGDETVILTGSATGLTSGTATLTITDDDPAPTAVTLSLNPAAVGESAAATTVTVDCLAEQLAVADSDHGYREPDGRYGHLGHGLPGDQRFHGDDPGGSDQRDGDAFLRSERGRPGGGG